MYFQIFMVPNYSYKFYTYHNIKTKWNYTKFYDDHFISKVWGSRNIVIKFANSLVTQTPWITGIPQENQINLPEWDWRYDTRIDWLLATEQEPLSKEGCIIWSLWKQIRDNAITLSFLQWLHLCPDVYMSNSLIGCITLIHCIEHVEVMGVDLQWMHFRWHSALYKNSCRNILLITEMIPVYCLQF